DGEDAGLAAEDVLEQERLAGRTGGAEDDDGALAVTEVGGDPGDAIALAGTEGDLADDDAGAGGVLAQDEDDGVAEAGRGDEVEGASAGVEAELGPGGPHPVEQRAGDLDGARDEVDELLAVDGLVDVGAEAA